jgi:hypothetical protein
MGYEQRADGQAQVVEEASTVQATNPHEAAGGVEPVGRLAPSTGGTDPCPTCGTVPGAGSVQSAAAGYVYAIGRIEPRFPQVSLEKEFAQATGRAEIGGLTDRQMTHEVLSQRENRYIARQLCWVLTIEGLETYILVPRDPSDLDLLIGALRPTPSPVDLDCVIGVRGPIASPELCGLAIPIAVVDQVYSFDRDELIKAIPRPEKTAAKDFAAAAEELFDRIMQMTDNAGGTDEDRALNYLAMRYGAIYAHAAEAFARNASLTTVVVAPSRLSGSRKIVDVVFSYTDRVTDLTDKAFVRVDVTEEFPFLMSKLGPYLEL